MSKEGYIYVMYDKAICHFLGECYKIGSTKNLEKRLIGHQTSHPDPLEFIYTSRLLKNYNYLEKKVHKKLENFRYGTSREFFRCSLEQIKNAIEEVCNSNENNESDEKIENLEQDKKCKFCFKTFSSLSNLIRHKNTCSSKNFIIKIKELENLIEKQNKELQENFIKLQEKDEQIIFLKNIVDKYVK